jgi:hypothetical protein
MKTNNRKVLLGVILGLFILSSFLILFMTKRTEEGKDIRPKAAITAYDVALTLNPTDGFTMGQEKTISVIINSGSYQIGSANLNITYNASVLDFVRLEKGNGFSDIIKNSTLPDPPSGNTTIKFIAVVMPGTSPKQGMIEAVKISFRPKTGTTSALISVNAEEITQYNTTLASGSHNLTSSTVDTTYSIVPLSPTPTAGTLSITPTKATSPTPTRAVTPTPTYPVPSITPTRIPTPTTIKTPTPTIYRTPTPLVKPSSIPTGIQSCIEQGSPCGWSCDYCEMDCCPGSSCEFNGSGYTCEGF